MEAVNNGKIDDLKACLDLGTDIESKDVVRSSLKWVGNLIGY